MKKKEKRHNMTGIVGTILVLAAITIVWTTIKIINKFTKDKK